MAQEFLAWAYLLFFMVLVGVIVLCYERRQNRVVKLLEDIQQEVRTMSGRCELSYQVGSLESFMEAERRQAKIDMARGVSTELLESLQQPPKRKRGRPPGPKRRAIEEAAIAQKEVEQK